MVKFLIATHGFLADGFKSSIHVLMGDEIANKIQTINAFVEGGVKDPKGAIEKICNELSEHDDLIIFTDLMYGSVNQFTLPYVSKSNVHVITGMNFPVLCEIISQYSFVDDHVRPDDQRLLEITDKAKDQLIFVENNVVEQPSHETNEDDFFSE